MPHIVARMAALSKASASGLFLMLTVRLKPSRLSAIQKLSPQRALSPRLIVLIMSPQPTAPTFLAMLRSLTATISCAGRGQKSNLIKKSAGCCQTTLANALQACYNLESVHIGPAVMVATMRPVQLTNYPAA